MYIQGIFYHLSNQSWKVCDTNFKFHHKWLNTRWTGHYQILDMAPYLIYLLKHLVTFIIAENYIKIGLKVPKIETILSSWKQYYPWSIYGSFHLITSHIWLLLQPIHHPRWKICKFVSHLQSIVIENNVFVTSCLN